MQTRATILILVFGLLLGSCAAPKTSKGLLDVGNGLAERVTVLNRPADRQAVHLHVQKIEAARKVAALAQQSRDSATRLFQEGRLSAADLTASERAMTRAEVAVLDAKLALARSGLLSASEMTMLDTDGDGLPDMGQRPLAAIDLLDAKVALCQKAVAHSKAGHARVSTLAKAGNVSAHDLRLAMKQVHEAELALLDAKLERASAEK